MKAYGCGRQQFCRIQPRLIYILSHARLDNEMEAKDIDWETIVNLLPDGEGEEADEQRK